MAHAGAIRFVDRDLMQRMSIAVTATVNIEVQRTWRFRLGWWLMRHTLFWSARLAGVGSVSCDIDHGTGNSYDGFLYVGEDDS